MHHNTTRYRLNTHKPHLAWLMLLISFPSVATVLITPALPQIAHFFTISNSMAQQTITLFIVGYAFGPLLYPPIANRFGRKHAIYAGLVLYFVSCLVCITAIWTHAFVLLLIGRLFMALGASAGMVITFTIINDFYHVEQARPITSYTMLAYSFMPALAIAMGGAITSHLSWIDCFYALFLYGFVILCTSMRLPETLSDRDHHALKIKRIAQKYAKGFRSGRIVLFGAIYGLMSSFIYIIASGAPFIGIKTIGLSPATYGLLFLIPYCGQFIGSFSAGKLNRRFSAYRVLSTGFVSVIIGTLVMLIGFSLGYVNTPVLIMSIFLMMLGLPITYSNTTVMAVSHCDDKATASAILSFTNMGITLLATLIFTLLPIAHAVIMPICFTIILVFASIFVMCAYRRYHS